MCGGGKGVWGISLLRLNLRARACVCVCVIDPPLLLSPPPPSSLAVLPNKGGLIGLAAVAIGLGPDYIPDFLRTLVYPVVREFADPGTISCDERLPNVGENTGVQSLSGRCEPME